MKSPRVHLDGFNFPTSPAAESTEKFPSLICQCTAHNLPGVIGDLCFSCKMNIQTNWCSSTNEAKNMNKCSGNRSISPFVVFQHLLVLLRALFLLLNVIIHLSNVNTTGKKRPGSKEGHRWHGSARDQIWRHRLLHHARGNRTLAVVSGARCQIITFRASEKKGELPMLGCGL